MSISIQYTALKRHILKDIPYVSPISALIFWFMKLYDKNKKNLQELLIEKVEDEVWWKIIWKFVIREWEAKGGDAARTASLSHNFLITFRGAARTNSEPHSWCDQNYNTELNVKV